MLESGKAMQMKKNRIFFFSFLAVLLFVATIVVAVTQSQKNASSSTKSYVHPVVKSTCAATLYPDLCVSSIANAPAELTSSIKGPKDVILAALNHTITEAEQNYYKVRSIIFSKAARTEREGVALQDCLETITTSVEELKKTLTKFKEYRSQSKKQAISQLADDLLILLSAAMTNQDTCLDGFSHSKAEKAFRYKQLDGRLTHVIHLCSNVLAMIKNFTDTDMAMNNQQEVVRLKLGRQPVELDEYGWPKWLSAGDRRLLQSDSVTPDVVVAADGSGDYRTVSDAVAAAHDTSSTRYVIKIKAGVYRENMEIRKPNLMFIGDGSKNTIITYNNSVRGTNSTTFHSGTVRVAAKGFLGRDITFENTAGPDGHQAVALRVNADYVAFYRCSFIAFQDTLYVHTCRQFYVKCIIIGTVDFIFGNAAVVIQDCDIHARRPNQGQRNMVTAQSRCDPNEKTGIVIQNCRIGATPDLEEVKDRFRTYLGRPWRNYSRTIVMQTEISDIIDPEGWFRWDEYTTFETLYYAEYNNTGAGADTSNRVTWEGFHVLTSASQVQMFTAENFISGSTWLPDTGFPHQLGL